MGGVRGRGSKNTPVKNHKFKRADVHPWNYHMHYLT